MRSPWRSPVSKEAIKQRAYSTIISVHVQATITLASCRRIGGISHCCISGAVPRGAWKEDILCKFLRGQLCSYSESLGVNIGMYLEVRSSSGEDSKLKIERMRLGNRVSIGVQHTSVSCLQSRTRMVLIQVSALIEWRRRREEKTAKLKLKLKLRLKVSRYGRRRRKPEAAKYQHLMMTLLLFKDMTKSGLKVSFLPLIIELESKLS